MGKMSVSHNNFYAVGFEDGSVWDFQHEDKLDFLSSDCLTSNQSLAEDIARRENGVVMQFGLTLKDYYKL